MTRILCAWDFDTSVLIGTGALIVGWWITNRGDYKRAACFCSGVSLMLFALTSPLDTLGDEYLFSAHMGQHLLLELAVPPLLLLGISPRFARMVVESRLGWAERLLGRPLVAWIVGIGMLAVWHIPALYDAALGNEVIHIIEHLSFMITAAIFWWPVLAPVTDRRIGPLLTQLYLLAGALAGSLLGIWLTFAPRVLYLPYLHPHDSLHLLAMIRSDWGLTPAIDQQLGGLLMWVGGGFIFLSAMLGAFMQWQADDTVIARSLQETKG
jgi:cytochrome c oxidase assembly factor CtaG